jgi:hypothetical protein
VTLYSQNDLYATIKTTLIPVNRRSKQRTNDERLDVFLLFRLPLVNGIFKTALNDQLVSQSLTTPATPKTSTPQPLMTQKRLKPLNPPKPLNPLAT